MPRKPQNSQTKHSKYSLRIRRVLQTFVIGIVCSGRWFTGVFFFIFLFCISHHVFGVSFAPRVFVDFLRLTCTHKMASTVCVCVCVCVSVWAVLIMLLSKLASALIYANNAKSILASKPINYPQNKSRRQNRNQQTNKKTGANMCVNVRTFFLCYATKECLKPGVIL